MGIFSSILAIWHVFMWLRRQRKEMEANAEAYLTEERAKAWRMEAEASFMALANGTWDKSEWDLPKPVKWFFAHTKADNRLGQFGQWFLKSSKLEIYRTH